jgi:uncharacterized protein (DUF1697 family)
MTYIALLRAVNVGGRKPVGMSELRRILVELGWSDVRSVLQSGNLVFRQEPPVETAVIEQTLERETRDRLGLETDFFVRNASEWKTMVENNPFREQGERDPGHLVVMFTKAAVNSTDVQRLQSSIAGPEILRAGDRHVYIVYPAGIGRSRLTNAVLERQLRTRASARNWNTILKLANLAND